MDPVRAPNCLVFHEPTLQRRLACLRLTNHRPTHLPCPIRFLRCSCLIFFLATLSNTDDLVMGKSNPWSSGPEKQMSILGQKERRRGLKTSFQQVVEGIRGEDCGGGWSLVGCCIVKPLYVTWRERVVG
jgi:hypothetical protein